MNDHKNFPTYFTDEHARCMTLRDYFAAKALSVVPSKTSYNSLPNETLEHYTARCAYILAEAMLEARE